MSIRVRSAAADALRAHHEVVQIAFLVLRCAAVPVVVQADCVDAVFREGADPVQALPAGLLPIIDPVLDFAIGQPGVVEADMHFYAVPGADVIGIEQRSRAAPDSKPASTRTEAAALPRE